MPTTVGVSLDETATEEDVKSLLALFGAAPAKQEGPGGGFGMPHERKSPFLGHAVFNRYHTEHEMLRYIKQA